MSSFDEMEIQEIYESAMNDPSLVAELGLDNLLEAIDEEKYENLENKTINSINKEIYEKINEIDASVEDKKKICSKLVGYKCIDELQEIENGKHIRWIKHGTKNLTNGGIVVNIKFSDNGAQILCLNNARRFNQVKVDTNDIFQRLSPEEQILLMANEYVHS
tara:strand:+ start:913 stop:1398 length:486 start_codon:yes stop_codon:yes gene_type:complete